MESVSEHIAKTAEALGANVLTENGWFLQTCAHGIRHPVGRVHADTAFDPAADITILRHEHLGPSGGALPVRCDGCCAAADMARAYYDRVDAEAAARAAEAAARLAAR